MLEPDPVMSKAKELTSQFPKRVGTPMSVRLARFHEPRGTDQDLQSLPEGRRSPAAARAYLWVFVVTFPIHELSNKGLVLVHLGQAHPAEERPQEAGVAVIPPSDLRLRLTIKRGLLVYLFCGHSL